MGGEGRPTTFLWPAAAKGVDGGAKSAMTVQRVAGKNPVGTGGWRNFLKRGKTVGAAVDQAGRNRALT